MTPHVAEIPAGERRNIVRDIAEAEKRGNLGHDCDAREWLALKRLLEESGGGEEESDATGLR